MLVKNKFNVGIKKSLFVLLTAFTILSGNAFAQVERAVWDKGTANNWYANIGWLRGSNYITSSAINQLEMWQKETFDPASIDKELGYAESIGFNAMRVFLHHAAWEADKKGFKNRVNQYLTIADKHHIKTMFVFFDDCWDENYATGREKGPRQGSNNSGMIVDPSKLYDDHPAEIASLEKYVKDVLTTVKNDKRIFL